MKNNFYLTGLLVVLLAGTYYFQEISGQKNYEKSLSEGLVSTEEIRSLKWNGMDARKKDGQWWMGETLLSHNHFRQIEEKLKRVRQIKAIEGSDGPYFSESMVIGVNEVPWKFGDMTLDRRGFYLSKGGKLMIAFIDGESRELTQDEQEIEKIKLDELKRLLASDLKEKQLFRYYAKLPLGKVVIEADGSLPYELNFAANTTSPPPIKGIAVHGALQEKFISLLTQLTIVEEVKKRSFYQKLASMTLSAENDSVVWELWIKSKGAADAVILDPKSGRAFLVVGGTTKVFFVHLQDYWDKKVIPSVDFRPFDRTTLIFIQGEKSAEVELVNSEPMKFISSSHKAKTQTLDALMHVVLNLKEKDQAERVSLLSISERKQYLSENNLRLTVLGQELVLVRKKEELIVANLTQGFKAHFLMKDENFHANFEDVLE